MRVEMTANNDTAFKDTTQYHTWKNAGGREREIERENKSRAVEQRWKRSKYLNDALCRPFRKARVLLPRYTARPRATKTLLWSTARRDLAPSDSTRL